MKLTKLSKLAQTTLFALAQLGLMACGGTEEEFLEEAGSEIIVPIRSECTPRFNRCNRLCERIQDPTALDSCFTSCGVQLQACIDCGDPTGCIIH